MNVTYTTTALASDEDAVRDTYAASLPAMPAARLVAELESCVRQNTYGSHAEQLEMVRKEIIARMSN